MPDIDSTCRIVVQIEVHQLAAVREDIREKTIPFARRADRWREGYKFKGRRWNNHLFVPLSIGPFEECFVGKVLHKLGAFDLRQVIFK